MAETEPQTGAPEAQHCYRHSSRETYISCSQCGRPICPDCMHEAAVGFRCPECVGDHRPTNRQWQGRRVVMPSGATTLTITLIVVNVIVYAAQLAVGSTVLEVCGGLRGGQELVLEGGLCGVEVADGQYYRLVSSAFLHGSLIHIGFNMLILWWVGSELERTIGWARMLVVYVASVLWGAAGALLLTNDMALTIGASGGVFGVMGAYVVIERQRGIGLAQSAVGGLLLLNLGLTFFLPNISVGGHLGGLIGGAAAAWVLSSFGKGSISYGRLSGPIYASVAALIVGAVAVSILVT